MSESSPKAGSTTVQLRLLGEAAVVLPDGKLHELERHDAALLALLALEGPQARAALARLLWPDAAPPKAMSSLRQRLFRLRRATGHAVVSGEAQLRLAPGVGHDLVFDDASSPGSDFGLLAGHHYAPDDVLGERVHALRERWEATRREALSSEADRLEASGDWDAALRLADRLLIAQPFSEAAHRRCMRLHYLRGDRSQALASFARCAAALRTAIDADPSEETRRLAALIEASGLPLTLARQAPALAKPRLDVALSRPPRLVGRELAWAQMQKAWAAGALIVLQGQAGVGKTRLADEFARSAGPTVVVKAFANEQSAPYALLARLLRQVRLRWPEPPTWAASELARLVPEWGEPPARSVEPLRLRQAVAAALEPWGFAASPALVIDDLQWADDASMQALLHWLTDLPTPRPPLIFCLRDQAVPVSLASWLEAHDSALAVERIDVLPMDRADLVKLLASLDIGTEAGSTRSAMADALFQQTGGNPFLVLEVLRSTPTLEDLNPIGAMAQPDLARLVALIQPRLNGLSAPARSLLYVAALTHAAFSAPLAAAVTGQSEAELLQSWQSLVRANLLQVDGALFDLVREAALQQIPAAMARPLHCRIAAYLQSHDARPDLTAAHWRTGGEWRQAAAAFEQAAASARATARALEELAWWDQAADCHEKAADEHGVWRARCGGVAVAMTSEAADARQARVDALLRLAHTDKRRLHALLVRSRALIDAGEASAALVDAREALVLASALEDTDSELTAAGWCGLALALAGQTQESSSLLDRYAGPAAAVTTLQTRLDFFGAQGYALHLAGDYERAFSACTIAAEAAESIGVLGEAAEQRLNLSTCLGTLGRRRESIAEGERVLDLWRRQGQPASGAVLQTQLAPNFYGSGRFSQALDMLQWSADHFRRRGPPTWQTIAEHRLAHVYLRLGQAARAHSCLSPLPPSADAGRRVTRTGIEARLQHLAGRPVLAMLQEALDAHEAALAPMDRHSLLLLQAGHLPPAEALQLSLRLLVEAEQPVVPPVIVHAHARAADACRRGGDRTGAARHARAAWQCSQASPPLDLGHAEFCWLVHQAALFGGDHATADAALGSGVDWIQAALEHVPPSYLLGFRELNPVNRALLAAGGITSSA